jgi:dienelactone hydrolase
MQVLEATQTKEVIIQAGDAGLVGDLAIPDNAQGLVIFAHGSGSSRKSPRNRYVADLLNQGNLATLLFDLLTPEEEKIDRQTLELRFDIELLSARMTRAIDWVIAEEDIRDLSIGLFGASTGAAAALKAAAVRPEQVEAIVSRGGRPDLAPTEILTRIKAPTLLIVGGKDETVIEMNQSAAIKLRAIHEIYIVPGASHLFEETGKLEHVAELARDWFLRFLAKRKMPE